MLFTEINAAAAAVFITSADTHLSAFLRGPRAIIEYWKSYPLRYKKSKLQLSS